MPSAGDGACPARRAAHPCLEGRQAASPVPAAAARAACPNRPIAVCRNSRMVGYQGLSVRSAASANPARTAPTARPPCPARRRDAQPTYRPRSRRSSIATTAAVSAKSSNSWPSSRTPCCSRIAACASLTSFCTLTKSMPGHGQQRAKRSSGIERLRSFKCVQLPAQHDPDAHPAVLRQPLAPFFDPLADTATDKECSPVWSQDRCRRRSAGSSNGQCRSKSGSGSPSVTTPEMPGTVAAISFSGFWTPRMTLAPRSATQRGIADEIDRIAQALFGEQAARSCRRCPPHRATPAA